MKTKKDKKKNKRDDGAQDKPVDGAIGISNKKMKMKMKKENEKAVDGGTDGAQDKPNERRSSKRSGRDGKAVIADARFSAVHSDPRFQHLSKHHSKVTLDSRFSSVFSDRAFSSSAPLDKRGKRKKLNPKDHPLLHYYRQEEDASIGEDVDGDSSSASDSELSVDAHVFSSSEDDDVDGDDEDGAGDASLDIDPKNIFKEDIPIIERETHRLAIVNLDWKYVKAVDLYVLLNSCLPKDGQILLVAIYPSEFGLKRMEEEAVHGPAALLESNKKNDEEDDNDDDDDEYKERLREYERSTLRYYFAVVECDSSATADYLYKTCDGIELERSSNVLDLRFIPDSMEFKLPPRDIVTEAPSNYQILDFQTPALQQSNIQLSWDEDEPGRKILKRTLKSEQLADVDLQEFLASDDGESSEGDDDKNNDDEALPDGKCQKLNKVDLYRALIQSRDGSDAEEDNDKDMEVTFNTGLEDISKRILEKKDKKSETVWEAYLKKRREKKKARKGGSKYSSDDDDSSDSEVEVPDEPDDFFIEEPSDADVKVGKKSSSKDSIKKSTSKKHRKERKPSPEAEKEQEASRAELELLLADDQGTDLKGYNLKSKKHKGKRGKEIPADDDIPSIDYDDPRFSAMFTSPLFALDPTDPQFKRSAAYMRQLRKKQKGGEEEATQVEEMQPPKEVKLLSANAPLKKHDSSQSEDTSFKNDKHELSSLVRRVKRKVESLQN